MQDKLNVDNPNLVLKFSMQLTSEDVTPQDVAEVFLGSALTDSNLILHSELYTNIKALFIAIAEDIQAIQSEGSYIKEKVDERIVNRLVAIGDDDNKVNINKQQRQIPIYKIRKNTENLESPVFFIERQEEANQLYALLLQDRHPVCKKIESCMKLLNANKEHTNGLYYLLKEAKAFSKGEIFTSKSFKDFISSLKSNYKIQSKDHKTVMQIANAFIGMKQEPKDFNEFIDNLSGIDDKRNIFQKILDYLAEKVLGIQSTKKVLGNFTKKYLQEQQVVNNTEKTSVI